MMKPPLSIVLVISLLLAGCGLIATPSATPMPTLPNLLPGPGEATPTAIVFTLTVETATPAEQEATVTVQPTDLVPTLQMEFVTDLRQTPMPQPESCQQPPPNWVVYVVQRNDTLSSLGQRTGVNWRQIQAANCLSGTTIFAGQRVYLPFAPATPAVTQIPPPGFTPRPPPPGDPRIEVSPGSGPAGSTFLLKIRDFDPSSVITVNIENSSKTVISSFPITMNAKGEFDVAWVSPADLAIGFYTVRPFRGDGTQGKSGTITIVP